VLKLTYSNRELQNFPGRTPGPPLKGEGREGRGGEGVEREGKEGGRGGMGGGGEGRGGEGRVVRHGLRLPRDKLWIRPCLYLSI